MVKFIIKTNKEKYLEKYKCLEKYFNKEMIFAELLSMTTLSIMTQLGNEYFKEDFNITINELYGRKNEFGNIVLGYLEDKDIYLRDLFFEKSIVDINNIYAIYIKNISHELAHKKFWKILEINKINCEYPDNNYYSYTQGKKMINEFYAVTNEISDKNGGDYHYNEIFQSYINDIKKHNYQSIHIRTDQMLESFIRFLPYSLAYNNKEDVIDIFNKSELIKYLDNTEVNNIINSIEKIDKLCRQYTNNIEKLNKNDIILLGTEINKIRSSFFSICDK